MSEELKKWKRLYASLKKENVRLNNDLEKKRDQLIIMALNLNEAQKAVDINKSIMRQSLLDSNQKEQTYIELVNKLRAKLKEMGFANFDNLGNENNQCSAKLPD